MMDLSDGLAGDIRHLCDSSNVGAVIDADALPLSPDAAALALVIGLQPIDLALSGGEDYELLLALAPEDFERAARAVQPVSLTRIGEIVPRSESISLTSEVSGRVSLPASGWTHF
jgi:thiamine-monophosphate kinase